MSPKKKKAAKKTEKKKAAKATGSGREPKSKQQGSRKRTAQRKPAKLYKEIEERLLQRREELLQQIAGEVGSLQRDALASVGDSADQAASAIQEELYSQLAEIEGQELQKIEYALQRIREGTYGTCEECGQEIPIGRLRIMPYTTLCVSCQARHEEEEAEGGPYPGAAPWTRVIELESLTAEEEEEEPKAVQNTETGLEEEEEEEDLDALAAEEGEEELEE